VYQNVFMFTQEKRKVRFLFSFVNNIVGLKRSVGFSVGFTNAVGLKRSMSV